MSDKNKEEPARQRAAPADTAPARGRAWLLGWIEEPARLRAVPADTAPARGRASLLRLMEDSDD